MCKYNNTKHQFCVIIYRLRGIYMTKENINNKFVIDDMIFLTNEQYTRYINSEVIGNKNITIDLLIDFLDNDYFYGYVLDLFNERIKCLSIVYVDMHGNRQINKYYKMDVLKALSNSILNLTSSAFGVTLISEIVGFFFKVLSIRSIE